MKTLEKKLIELGIKPTKEMLGRFDLYYKLLIEWNEKFNLTAITEEQEVADKHFIDSVLPYNLISSGAYICDMGSGAGFPSIPLKIVRDDLKFVLVDSLDKRVGFLNEVVKELKLDSVECVHARAEDFSLQNKYREKFDVCIARAVAKLNTLCEYCLPYIKVGGTFIAYKSKDYETELNEAQNAIKELGGQFKQAVTIKIPDTDIERVFIVIQKNKVSPNKYPRQQNKPKLNPII